MNAEFKKSMTWLHTWLGLLAGWLLYVVFFTGTISYYHSEVTTWMKPELSQSKPSKNTTEVAINLTSQLFENSQLVYTFLPQGGQNTIKVMHIATNPYTGQSMRIVNHFDANTAEVIQSRETAGGSFLYRFHYKLFGMPFLIGEWIVAIATFFMLIVIISGILIHKRIFKDLFVFRPNKKLRTWLDSHILIAVAALPFLIMITYSGLVLFMNLTMPWAMNANYENPRDYYQELRQLSPNTPIINEDYTNNYRYNPYAIRQLTPEKLLYIYNKANEIWPNNIGSIYASKNAYGGINIDFRQKNHDTIFYSRGEQKILSFDGISGEWKSIQNVPYSNSAVAVTQSVFDSLHKARFANPTMRFVFFIFGVFGTFAIASGLILWVKKRKKNHENKFHIGYKIIQKLNVGTILGMFIALGVYFATNRFLPAEAENRAIWEINAFFIAWLFSYIWASIRSSKQAWAEQSLFCSLLFASLIFINFFTNNCEFWEYFQRSTMFLYFDIFFLMCAILFFLLFKRIKNKTGVIYVK